jgi:hypothetical protein
MAGTSIHSIQISLTCDIFHIYNTCIFITQTYIYLIIQVPQLVSQQLQRMNCARFVWTPPLTVCFWNVVTWSLVHNVAAVWRNVQSVDKTSFELSTYLEVNDDIECIWTCWVFDNELCEEWTRSCDIILSELEVRVQYCSTKWKSPNFSSVRSLGAI